MFTSKQMRTFWISLKLIVSFALALRVLSYFYIQTPDGMSSEDQWLLRKIYVGSQLMRAAMDFGGFIRYDTRINIARSLRHLGSKIFAPDSFDQVTSTDHELDGVKVTIHRKEGFVGQVQPALFYIHGGAWVFEFREWFALFERYLAEKLNHTIVSVDYPLAPENPYPIPFDHCLKALLHIHRNAAVFGIDPDRISLAGDSAGGNIAAAIALKLRDDNTTFLYRHVLIVPALQFATFHLSSFIDNEAHGTHSPQEIFGQWLFYIDEDIRYMDEFRSRDHLPAGVLNGKGWPYLQKYYKTTRNYSTTEDHLLSNLERKMHDPYLSPIFADSLSGLPKTLVLTSEYDILRDEGRAYGARLKDEGVDVTVQEWSNFHGAYLFFTNSRSGRAMADAVVDFLVT